jgi:hypothetical protein
VNIDDELRVKRNMRKLYPVLPAPPHYTPVDDENDDGIVIDIIDTDEEPTRIALANDTEESTKVSDATKVYAYEVEVLLNCGHLSMDQVVDILRRAPPKVSPPR